MKRENVTIEKAMEIFADYLENITDAEIVQTQKMGLIMLEDISRNQSRADLVVEQIEDGNDLAEKLLRWETYDAFYNLTHGAFDLKNCDDDTRRKIVEMIRPRLKKLPEEYEEVVMELFAK